MTPLPKHRRPLGPVLAALCLLALLCSPRSGAQQAELLVDPDPFVEIGDGVPATVRAAPPEDNDAAKAPLNAQISQHIMKLADEERAKRLKFMTVVIDDVARICELDPEQREQLDLAAKGAAERSMGDWHAQAERYFRTRLDGTDLDAAKEMLESMGNVNFGANRAEEEGESLELWKETLQAVLSSDQVAEYESVLQQREQDRIEAYARISVATLDSHLRFTPVQKDQMHRIVLQAATEYLEEVQRYWGDYFERGMLMSLANAGDEEELKSVLTPEQYERLREATSNFDHFWEQRRRQRRAQEKAAERRRETVPASTP